MSSVRPGGGAAPGDTQSRPHGPYPTHYVRDLSAGVNLSTSRESIEDNEAWWMEGLMPQAKGNLAVLPGTKAWSSPSTESGAPSYALSFSVGTTPYVLVIWKNSGNAYVWVYGVGMTQIATGLFTSGSTSACAWNNQGVLIIDSVHGYYDWNVSVGNTLTSLSNSVQSITLSDGGSGYTSAPSIAFGGPGSGASATAFIGVSTIGLNNAGVGYAQGDVLTLPYLIGGGGEAMTVTVAAVDGTGKITAFTLTTRGRGVAVPVTPVAAINGSGSGAKFDVVYAVTFVRLDNRGSGYTSSPSMTFTLGGAPARQASASAAVSGSLTGTAIAAYAGRAWIASGRTVSFTDVGSYASFVGSGSSFNITDSYLVRSITALYAANNYLYIFGDTSVDVLSNVTVTDADTTNFSRVNVSASVGCNQAQSIFSYYRSVMFANGAGFWRLSGATPECVSEGRLDLLIQSIDFSVSICGAPVTLNGVLCAAFLITFTDNFVLGATSRMVVLYFNGRWFFARLTVDGSTILPLSVMVSIPSPTADRAFQLWAFGSNPNFLYQGFEASSTAGRYWRVMTKIYDLGKPLVSKQITRAGAGLTMSTTNLGNFAIAIDTEAGAALSPIAPLNGTGFPYRMLIGSQDIPDNSKYVGFTATGSGASTDVSRVEWLAFEHKENNAWQ